jgi:hypothetical protein
MITDYGVRPFADSLETATVERFPAFILRVAGTIGGGVATTALLAAVLH